MTRSVLAACALALAAPLAIFGLPAPAAAQSISAEAQRFGELYVPSELGTSSALVSFDQEFLAAVSADASITAMEKQFPGLIDAAHAAARAELVAALDTGLPTAQTNIGRFAQSRFTGAELTEINRFLASASGQSMLRAVADQASTAPLADKMRSGENGKMPTITGTDLEQSIKGFNPSALSAEDRAAAMMFGVSPVGRKMDALSADLSNAVATEMNAIMQAMAPNIQTAVITAISAHVSTRKAP